MPPYVDVVNEGSVLHDGALLFCSVLAVGLSAGMPHNVDVVNAGFVALEDALLLRPELAVRLSASMPHNVDVVNEGFVLLQMLVRLRPVRTPINPARPPPPNPVTFSNSISTPFVSFDI